MGQSKEDETDRRHEDALASVRELILLGIEADLESMGASDSAEQKAQRREILFEFELDRTMDVAKSLDSETLEYIATQISTFDNKHEWIHRFLNQIPKWSDTAGDRAAIAIRDYVFFRKRNLRENSIHVFLEMYECLGIKDEGIHLLTGSALKSASAILDLSIHSREIDAAIRTNQIEFEPYAEIYEVGNLRSEATNEAWAADHLTREMAAYLHANPDDADRAHHYMDEKQLPLHAIQMPHFKDYMATQSSISSGVL